MEMNPGPAPPHWDWYTLRHVPSDGDCLFHAVHAQTDISRRRLRDIAWLEMRDHEDDYAESLVSELPYAEAIAPMRRLNVWRSELGDLAPYALARGLHCTFFVHTPERWYYTHGRDGRSENVVYLHLERNHYSVLVPNETFLRWEDQFYE